MVSPLFRALWLPARTRGVARTLSAPPTCVLKADPSSGASKLHLSACCCCCCCCCSSPELRPPSDRLLLQGAHRETGQGEEKKQSKPERKDQKPTDIN